jgi:thiol:disulfide interchange protein
VPLGEAKYFVYHMGADWCEPCRTMIKNVWGSNEVKAQIKKIASKLYILDADDVDDERYFEFYNIDAYPTILIFKPDNLDNPVQRIEGGRTKAQMLKVLDGLK